MGTVPTRSDDWVDRGARPALVTFVVLVVGAGIYYLVIGRHQWFYSDEWDQIVTRGLTDPDDLLRPHNDHWQTIPTVMYRVLFHVFGLRTYLPYQLPVVLLFLMSAALLRVIARRAGVGPWIATIAAGVFLLLGSGMENIVFGVQVSMMGSFAFGLLALVLTDHDGPFDRRDAWAMACALVALLCSGVAVTMIAVIALAVVLRRGWKPALLFAAPLGAVYLVWAVLYGTSSIRPGSAGSVVRFVAAGTDATFTELGQVPGAGILLGVVLLGGLGLYARQALSDRTESEASSGALAVLGSVVRHRIAVPVALLLGAIGFLIFTALGRAGPFGPDSARAPRYFALAIPMVLPLLALAVDAICRRSRAVGAVAVLVLVMGVPGNVVAGQDEIEARDASIARAKALIVALPELPEAADTPDDLRPLPEAVYGPDITMGFLRQAADLGWIPTDGAVDPAVAQAGVFRLSIYQTWTDLPADTCTDLGAAGSTGVAMHVETGAELRLAGGFVTVTDASGGATGPSVTYNPNRGNTLDILRGPLDIRLTSGGVNGNGQLCLG